MRRIIGLGLLATASFIPTALDFASAGAEDWLAPSGSTDILSPAYVSAPGHTPSVSASCSGTDSIEVGIHPWDAVARNLQVFAADGSMLLNITSGNQLAIIPLADQPARLIYNGDVEFALATERCAVPAATIPPPAVTVPTPTTVVEPTYPPTIPPIEAVAPPVEKRTGIDDPPYLSAANPVPPLPATGFSPELALLGVAAIGGGSVLVAKTRRTHR